MQEILITITASVAQPLQISANTMIIGSQFDNKQALFKFIRPEGFEEHRLAIALESSFFNQRFAPVSVVNDNFLLTNLFTQGERVRMQVILRQDDILLHSNMLEFLLRPSIQTVTPVLELPLEVVADWPRVQEYIDAQDALVLASAKSYASGLMEATHIFYPSITEPLPEALFEPDTYEENISDYEENISDEETGEYSDQIKFASFSMPEASSTVSTLSEEDESFEDVQQAFLDESLEKNIPEVDTIIRTSTDIWIPVSRTEKANMSTRLFEVNLRNNVMRPCRTHDNKILYCHLYTGSQNVLEAQQIDMILDEEMGRKRHFMGLLNYSAVTFAQVGNTYISGISADKITYVEEDGLFLRLNSPYNSCVIHWHIRAAFHKDEQIWKTNQSIPGENGTEIVLARQAEWTSLKLGDWIESEESQFGGTVVLISHDKQTITISID